jgi:uncharacterized membrane protein
MKDLGLRNKGIMSILMVLILIVPSVAALNVGNGVTEIEDKEQKMGSVLDEYTEDLEIFDDFSDVIVPNSNPNVRDNIGLVKDGKMVSPVSYREVNIPDNKNVNKMSVQTTMAADEDIGPEPTQPTTSGSTSSSSSSPGTRGARQENYDLEVRSIAYDEKNAGWAAQYDLDPADAPQGTESYWWEGNQAYLGSFFVGTSTQITATIRNNGAVAVTNIMVNFTVYDYTFLVHENYIRWGMKVPQTKSISSLGPQQEQTVSINWNPAFASEFVIFAEVESLDFIDDPDFSNNGLGFYSRVALWQDDVESGAGSWAHSATTGGDNWHISSSMANPNGMHTTTDGWYEGSNDGPGAVYPGGDYYADPGVLTLTSPTLDFGNIITKNSDEGNLLVDYVAAYACLLTGDTETNSQLESEIDWTDCDVLYFHDVSDDGGGSWEPMNNGFNVMGYMGTRFTVTSVGGILYFTNPVWGTEWYPAPAYITSDGTSVFYNPGAPLNLNVTSWNNIKFRMRFQADSDGVNQIGYYLDDFITWGVQDWTIPMDVDITEFTPPAVSGVPIIHPNEAATFTTKIENEKGAAAKTFNAVLTIKNMGTGDEWQEQTKSVTLGVEEEKSQQWSWTPTAVGDYRLTITAGDLNEDYFWLDNEEYRIVRVRESTDEILLVDDDNSDYTNDDSAYYFLDTLGKMCDALEDTDIPYDVYHVGSNESGPEKTVMQDYTTVIWMTGLDNQHGMHAGKPNYRSSVTADVWDTSLKTDDETQLEMFLNLNDHNLWLISPSYVYDEYGTSQKTTGTSDFARQYLHVWAAKGNVTQQDNNGNIITRGTPDPLVGILDTLTSDKTGKVSYDTYETEPPLRFSDIGCTVEGVPTEEATLEIFNQNDAQNAYNAISFAGDGTNQYKSVFFAFNFYLLEDPTHRADLVDKVLTFFGLMGGVQIELMDPEENVKYVEPSGEIDFQFKVTNVGKKTDTMTLDSEIYSATTAPSATWPVHKIEIGGVVKSTVDVAGTSSSKNYKDDIYLKITAPDWEKSSAKWNTEYSFVVTVESEKTGNTSYAVVTAVIKLYSDLSITFSQSSKKIDVDDSWDCVITLKNNTNGGETYDVALKIDGEGKDLATFSENNQKTITVTLTPNTARQVLVKIKSDENELAGYHNISIEVKGTSTLIIHETTTIETIITQFFEVSLNSEDETRVVIDPNDVVGDTISESFTVDVSNWGNGYDKVTFTVESHEDNEVDDELLEAVELTFKGNDLDTEFDDIDSALRTTQTVAVENYDISNDPMEGQEEVTVTINMNKSVPHGEYWFNVIAESQEGLNDEDDPENNNITLMIKIIKPDLEFNPQDKNGSTYDEFPDRVIDNYRFMDDIYEEVIPLDDIEEEFIVTLDHRTDRDDDKGTYGKEITISLEIVLDNIGDSTANLEAVLQTIVINVSHGEEDEFGEFVIIEDATLYPISPTTAEIKPGQNLTVTFETFDVDWMDPSQDTEVIYTFTVTVDGKDFVMEQDEFNNDDTFELTILHLKKPKKSKSGSPGFELVILFAAIGVALLAGMGRQRRRRK